MNLLEKQKLFVQLLPRLLDFAYSRGYECTLGESWRPPEVAAIYKANGVGISNSLHWSRLAIDLNLYRNGAWLQNSEDHRVLGEFWEKLSTDKYQCCWGGRFGDGNHYSIEHGGVK